MSVFVCTACGNNRRVCPAPQKQRGSANGSPSHIEPVSGMPKRKSENGEQRLPPQSHKPRPENPEFADPRIGRASLTRGNVAGSHIPGNRIGETALAGWGGRIRTHKCASKIGL